MKKHIFAILLLVLALSLSACGISELRDFSLENIITKLKESSTATDPYLEFQPETTENVSVTVEPTEEAVEESTQEITETEREPETSAPETEAPTPTETTAPTYPEIFITEDIQYRTNIFLSNFSEVWFNETYIWDEATQTFRNDSKPFVTATADPTDLMNFCWMNIKLNSNSDMKTIRHNSGSYYGVHIDDLNDTCERFFGRTLSRSELPSGEMDEYGQYVCLLIDDYVCKTAADGETYPNMTVSHKIYDMGNGLYQVDFTIYTVNDIGGDSNIVAASGIVHDKSVYYFTSEDAVSHPAFSYHLSGTAVVKPYVTPRGTSTYQLISYELIP